MLASLIKSFNFLAQQLILQQYCVFCGCSCQQQLCSDCYAALPRLSAAAHCSCCLEYLAPKELNCANCREQLFYFTRIIAGFNYDFPLDKVLHVFKYHGRLEYATLLSGLFYAEIMGQIDHLPDAIIPVPLHAKRHKQRGFNQVHELLREFRRLQPQLPWLSAVRQKDTQQQAALNRHQRIKNLTHAFTLNCDLTGKHIAIVDDVVTTATTVNELAQLAKNHGARQIDIWCLMRALPFTGAEKL